MKTMAAPVSSLGLAAGNAPAEESQRWFARARKVLAGGISSSARATVTGPWPYPLYITRGRGSHIWDADEHEFIDYLLSYGAAILGHAHPELLAAVNAQLQRGTMFGTCNTVEVELAEQICRMVPGVELVRFANSGSEAICGAIRAARGYTGKTRVLKFEGHYHGWVDALAVSNRPTAAEAGPLDAPISQPHSRGIPSGVIQDVLIAPFNDRPRLACILQQHGGELAAIILEPVVANNACLAPEPGYLAWLRDECTRRGIILIFDEIVTGFRLARGGAAEAFGLIPDLAIFSKALGGGFAISAFGGKQAIMQLVAANRVKHGGTYNGNPLCAAAALCTLRQLERPGVLETIHQHGRMCMEALRRAMHDRGIPCAVQGNGAMFQVVFSRDGRPLRHYRDLWDVDVKRYAAFRHALLQTGVHVNDSPTACWFISASHTSDDIAVTVEAIESAAHAIG
jgi:glutamate-1-semialdehyde 2,1-aminomutase